MEFLVVLRLHHFVEARDLLDEGLGRNAVSLRQVFERVELLDDAVLETVLEGLSLGNALAVGKADGIDGLAVLHEA